MPTRKQASPYFNLGLCLFHTKVPLDTADITRRCTVPLALRFIGTSSSGINPAVKKWLVPMALGVGMHARKFEVFRTGIPKGRDRLSGQQSAEAFASENSSSIPSCRTLIRHLLPLSGSGVACFRVVMTNEANGNFYFPRHLTKCHLHVINSSCPPTQTEPWKNGNAVRTKKMARTTDCPRHFSHVTNQRVCLFNHCKFACQNHLSGLQAVNIHPA